MKELPSRIVRTLIAGLLGALKALVLLVIGLIIGIVVIRAGLQWYASGSFSLFPSSVPASNRVADLAVLDATPAEAAKIRDVLATLRYQLPPRAVTFSVAPSPLCAQCGGDYVPALDLIQIDRSLVDQGGPVLRHAIAHEVGHYVDEHYLRDSQRAQFMQLRHVPANVTWLSGNRPWQDRPSEDFAEVFAVLDSTTAESPPETSYGPLRDAAAFEQLLASAGVRFGQPSSRQDWRSVVTEELTFFKDITADPTASLLWEIAILVYVLYGALPAMHDAWRQH